MEPLEIAIILLFSGPIFALCRTTTTYIHELGHGIAALLLTEGPIRVYIGTYGGEEGTITYGIGRLTFYHKFSFLQANGGVVYPGTTDNVWSRIIISLMGPLASAVSGAIVIWLALAYDWPRLLQILAWFFFISTVIDLVYNLYPNPAPIILDDGSVTYQDGTAIIMQLKWRKVPVQIKEAISEIDNTPFKSIAILEKAYDESIERDIIRPFLLNLYISTSSWKKGLHFYEKYPGTPEQVNDFIALPVFESMSGDHEKALRTSDRLLDLFPENPLVLTNRNHILNESGQYEEAKKEAEALLHQPQVAAYAHSNLAFALAHLGDTISAKEHALISISMDSKNPYAYLTLGIIHLLSNNRAEADEAFNQAYEINPTTFGLDKHYSPPQQ